MHFKLLFPSDYVGAHDLNGKDATMEIERVNTEDLKMAGGTKKVKPVVWFKGAKKRMVLNKTNAKIIAAMFGADTAKWIGKTVTVYPTTTLFGGETVECVRIREGVKP